MDHQTVLNEILSKPDPESLWELKCMLLESDLANSHPLLVIIDHFFEFMNDLVAGSTAREYSHVASLLDIGAVAGVALENLVGGEGSNELWKRFALGAASEAMMVLAARQYVKAWEEETDAIYNSAVWFLKQAYWNLSQELQPELPSRYRTKFTNELVNSLKSDQIRGIVKAGLIIRLFQILLITRINLAFKEPVEGTR